MQTSNYENAIDFYNKHYIRTNKQGEIVYGFSDAFEQPQEGDVCINERGGYQFRLFHGGSENPLLHDEGGNPLYRWDGENAAPVLDEGQLYALFDIQGVFKIPIHCYFTSSENSAKALQKTYRLYKSSHHISKPA